jgi:PhzF family phenazine biosynthesis protein
MTTPLRFKQIDVFTRVPFKGNPLAVVFDADHLSTEQMQAIANWTNLSETTFVLAPTDPSADYRVRIFTPGYELPFAGHPTLGTAHALLDAGLAPQAHGHLIQQCAVGLVPVNIGDDGSLAFRAPAAEFAPLSADLYPSLASALGSDQIDLDTPPTAVRMGVGWLVAQMRSADACMAIRPDHAASLALLSATQTHGIAVYGPHPDGEPTDFEVRAMVYEPTLYEDPVTGSANACIARLLAAQARVPGNGERYSVRQGTALGRNGRVAVTYLDGEPWIGGASVTVVSGTFQP